MKFQKIRLRSKTILALALPIIGGMLSQTLMNFADAMMVGHLPNADAALNAQGVASQAVWAVAAFLIGIGSAVQTWASRRMGEKRPFQSGFGLSLALELSLLIGVPISLFGVYFSQEIVSFLIHSDNIQNLARPYFLARSASWFLVMLNFSFRGFFNGISRPRIYFTVIWLTQIVNIVLSLLLIYGYLGLPAMGVAGAGLGTSLATLFSTILYFFISLWFRKKYGAGEVPMSAHRRREILRLLGRLSVPAGLSGILTSLGFLTFMMITDRIGSAEAAASTILVQMASLSFLPAIGFGLAAATLVSQSIGAGDSDSAYKWGLDTARLGGALLGSVGILFLIAPDLVVSLFTNNRAVAFHATLIIQILGFGLFFDAFGNVLSQALIGAGYVRPVLVSNLVGMWLFFLPGAFVWGYLYRGGMLGLWIPLFVYRIGLAAVMYLLFRSRRWALVQI